MRLPPDLKTATFLSRPNRFTALIDLRGQEALCHVANSGRLAELFQPGRTVHVAPRAGPRRKTPYDLLLVRLAQGWVSTDASIPPLLVHEALAAGALPELRGYSVSRREVVWGDSRLDLALDGKPGPCLVEVKSVTLVQGRLGLFPDAPTLRGSRHLGTLMAARRQGMAAAVIFVIQREDAAAFSPNDMTDPAFGAALRQAGAEGVQVLAYRCRVTPEEVAITGAVPVAL